MKESTSKMTEEQRKKLRKVQEKHISLKEDADKTVRLSQLSKEERARVLAIIQEQKKETRVSITDQVLERVPETPVPEGLLETYQEEDSETLQLPKLSKEKRALVLSTMEKLSTAEENERVPAFRHLGFNDAWLSATFFTACAASIISLSYFFLNHQILLMNDSYSHMLIARRVFDNLTPGVTQLGGIWLPLPHLLMLPFIWNNYLWYTGLAGSFVSMPCYVLSAVYLFLAARRLTHSSSASFVGSLIFLLNPNILYMQVTPLSELVLIATLTIASYYFLAWAQEENVVFLILSAAATFLATLARYDGWPLFLVFLVFIALIGWLKHRRWAVIEGNLILFSVLGGLGIVLWFLWNLVVFGDALYFQHSEFSSQAQQKDLPRQLYYLHTNILISYHNIWVAVRTYNLDVIYTIGLGLFVLAVLSVITFFLSPATPQTQAVNSGRAISTFIRRYVTSEMLAVAAFLVPYAFYIFSLYMAQAVIFVPGAAPAHAPLNITFYNVRYGIESVAPATIFVASFASGRIPVVGRLLKQRGRVFLQIVISLVIIVQTVGIARGGVITLQDSQYGLDCASLHPVVVYLVQHYNGGRILEDLFSSKATSLESDVGIDFKNIVYEGSGDLWKQALRDPVSEVDWIMVNPNDTNDFVAQHLDVTSKAFLSQFTVQVQEEDGLLLFRRSGLPPLPTHPLPPGLLTSRNQCGIGSIQIQQTRNILL